MTSPPTPFLEEGRATPAARVTFRETTLIVVGILALVALLRFAGGAVLWTRPLWFDEICCTLFVVEDAASPLEVIQRVARGEDYAPPLLHLMVWSSARLAGGLTPVVLRTLSLICVSLALVFVYLALRRRLSPIPSLTGALAVASHSLVIAHAFEGRFYGPWLFFAAAFAWSLGIDPRGERSVRRDLALAMTAVLLATIHWFGVLSLGLMVAAAALARGGRWTARLRFVAPSSVGIVALAACIPLIFTHRAGVTEIDALWVPPLSAAQLGVMARLFFLSTIPVLAVVLLLIDSLRDTRSGDRPRMDASPRLALRDPAIAALAALAVFPGVLVVVSLLLQPSMLDRYAIVTVLAWAPFVSLASASLDRGGRIAVLLLVAAMTALSTRRVIEEKREFARMVRSTEEAYAQAGTMGVPIVFASLHTAYPVAGPRRAERRALFVELPDSTIQDMIPQPRLGWLRRHVAVERNIARGHARVYGFPVLVPQAQLDTTPRFVLVGPDESFPRLYKQFEVFAAKVFPHHRATRLTPYLALLAR